MRADRCGFTLIELLVVIGVIVVLIGMAMPLLTVARNTAQNTNTRSLLHKVEGALGAFRLDAGGHPYLDWSTATLPPPGEDTDPPPNQLAYHLCRNPDSSARADLQADMDTAATAAEAMLASGMGTNFTSSNATVIEQGRDGATIAPSTVAYVMPATTFPASAPPPIIYPPTFHHLRPMAKSWARSNILIGHVDICRTAGASPNPWTAQTGSPLIPAAQRRSKGWSADYLSREIPARCIQGDAICDDWGNPLVYLCPVQMGAKDFLIDMSRRGTSVLGGQPVATWVNPAFFGLVRTGRQATATLASDRRVFAAARFAFTYELWSRGRDGLISSLRTGYGNRDNLGAEDYDKGLQ